jgi:formate hydrogenlyase subunit 3/multisubunit Na+/H+ antiporter MnhD subunit
MQDTLLLTLLLPTLAEAPAPMSARLSGVIISAGAYAILRVSLGTVDVRKLTRLDRGRKSDGETSEGDV